MTIIKNKRGKYVLRKLSFEHLGYAYADAEDLKNKHKIYWWSTINSSTEFYSLEDLKEAIKNYNPVNFKDQVVQKGVKFGQ